MSRSDGQKIVRALAACSDVMLENFKVGALAKYSPDFPSLEQSALIYCSITGFGQTGPYRDKPGHDFMIQGIGRVDALRDELLRARVSIADTCRFD